MQTKQIKEQAVKVAKSYTKPVLYILLGIAILYGSIYLFTGRDHMPVDLQATIDSLTKANKVLIEHQKQIDSTIRVYEAEVKQVDNQIDHIKEKTTIIR